MHYFGLDSTFPWGGVFHLRIHTTKVPCLIAQDKNPARLHRPSLPPIVLPVGARPIHNCHWYLHVQIPDYISLEIT